jgi:hypothetical protein
MGDRIEPLKLLRILVGILTAARALGHFKQMSKLHNFSWKTNLFWLVISLLMLSAVWVVLGEQEYKLICARSQIGQGSCQVYKRTLLQLQPAKIREFPVSMLQGAELEETRGSMGGLCYQVILRFTNNESFSTMRRCEGKGIKTTIQNTSDKITSFATSADSSLRVDNGRTVEGNCLQLLILLVITARILQLWYLDVSGRGY